MIHKIKCKTYFSTIKIHKSILGYLILLFIGFQDLNGFCQNTTPAEKINYDTLILRDICDYCSGENSTFFPRNFSPNTKCLCYEEALKVDSFIANNCKSIKYIKIENPSKIIFNIDFDSFSELNTLMIFGNDFDVIRTLPPYLMRLQSLKNIIVSGVGIPSKEIKRLKKLYPNVEFSEEIPEYEKDWDELNKYSKSQTIDMTLVLRKNNKLALWEFPYENNPTYSFNAIIKNNYGGYVCVNDSGVDFIQPNSHIKSHSDFFQETTLKGDTEDVSIYFINNGGHKDLLSFINQITIPILDMEGYEMKDTTIIVFDTISFFRGGKSGLLDKSFKHIIPVKYDELLIPVSEIISDKFYKPDVNLAKPYHSFWIEFGEIDNPTKTHRLDSKELIIVREKELYGAYNFSGELAIPVIYKILMPIKDDSLAFFALKPDLKYDIYNHQSKIIKKGRIQKSLKFNDIRNNPDYILKTIEYKNQEKIIAPQLLIDFAKKSKILSYDSAHCNNQVNVYPFEVSKIMISSYISKNMKQQKHSDVISFSITLIDDLNKIEVSYKIDELKMIYELDPNETLLKAILEIDEYSKNAFK
jgi:hypothetical protein